jgi:hypothetical protein
MPKARFYSVLALLFLVACGYVTEPATSYGPPPINEEIFVPAPPLEPLSGFRYYLSDLRPDSVSNTFGPAEKDSSNGTSAGGDGRTLSINGRTYAKGLGVTSPSELVYNLGGVCNTFSAHVGVDDLWNATRGSVSFEVYADNLKIWDSGLMTPADPYKTTRVLNVTGKQFLKLVTTVGGDTGQDDYADWAIPVLSCNAAPPALFPADAGSKGFFGPVEPWPTIPTHAALLPDSTILFWYSRDIDGTTRSGDYNDQEKHDTTIVDSWSISSNRHTRRDNSTTDIFCAGYTLTADGNLFVAGGNLGSLDGNHYPGSKHTNLFTPSTNTWSKTVDMNEGRWYPTVTALPNKELLITAGWSDPTTTNNYIPEVWNPGTNTLRALSTASTQGRSFQHLYPWLHVAPNGQVFYSGSTSVMAYLDTAGTGSWGTTVYNRDGILRSNGTSVMYEPGKLLVVGGGGNTHSAVTINLNNAVQTTTTGAMNFGRTHLNATLLADGSVFVNGGNTSGANFDDSTSVYSSEIWNPATGVWQLGASAQKPRNYHAISLLLPDGRVLTGGGGGCGSCGVNHQNIEMYYPPYLFKKDGSGLLADRPRVTFAPSTMSYASSYTLYTPLPPRIRKVALVALGSVTHAFNMNQRYVPLRISSRDSTALTLTVAGPTNANLAPPGYYMLFVINTSGVPSVARIVQVQ